MKSEVVLALLLPILCVFPQQEIQTQQEGLALLCCSHRIPEFASFFVVREPQEYDGQRARKAPGNVHNDSQ